MFMKDIGLYFSGEICNFSVMLTSQNVLIVVFMFLSSERSEMELL